MIFYNSRKWNKVPDGYAPVDGKKMAVNFISDLLMKKYLITGSAHEVGEVRSIKKVYA
jgi:hypothetical protein